jgi:hypothetical protein
MHSFYNQHVETFEMIEETVKQSVKAAAGPIKECLVCSTQLLKSIPEYIDAQIKRLESIYSQPSSFLYFVPFKLG